MIGWLSIEGRIFLYLGFTFSIGAHSISEEVAGFSPLWFPQGKLFVSLVIIAVHVILSDKILRSYWLNDKNLKLRWVEMADL